MANPYSSPQSHPGHARVGSKSWLLGIVPLGFGIVAAALVYVGDAFAWPHFNRRDGYIGTEFIRSFLYAINDPYAIHVVALIWFFYASVTIGVATIVCRRLCNSW